MTKQPISIGVDEIDASNRLKPVDPQLVQAYAALAEQRIAEGLSPLINPIVVRPSGAGYKLTAGANRLAALREVQWTLLNVGDDVIVREETEDAAFGSEIYENLAHGEMSALDRAIFLHAAKERADAKRGETRGRKRKDQQLKEDKKVAESAIIFSERFTKEAANRINLSERQIFEAVSIAKALVPGIVDELRGTMLADNQNELKQLAALDHASQRAAVKSIKSGEAKNIAQARVQIGLDKPTRDDPQARIYADLLDRWHKASKKTRDQFMADVGLAFAKAEKA